MYKCGAGAVALQPGLCLKTLAVSMRSPCQTRALPGLSYHHSGLLCLDVQPGALSQDVPGTRESPPG